MQIVDHTNAGKLLGALSLDNYWRSYLLKNLNNNVLNIHLQNKIIIFFKATIDKPCLLKVANFNRGGMTCIDRCNERIRSMINQLECC